MTGPHGTFEGQLPEAPPPGMEVEEVYNLPLHGANYVITIVLRGDGGEEGEPREMVVEVELEESGERWIATFGAAYLEEITAKTGNFKKFGTFARMLLKALERSSESVFVDLLTYEDLEMLRARRNANKTGGASAAAAPGDRKTHV